MEFKEFKAKTVEEALTNASMEFGVASTEIEYEVIEKGTSGFLGIGAKPAVIKAKKKDNFLDEIMVRFIFLMISFLEEEPST